MRILSLKKENSFLPFSIPSVSEKDIDEVVDTLRSNWITVGPKTKIFENNFKEYIGCKHAIAVNSCTAGLHLALVVTGVGYGDDVITTPYTFCATAEVIEHLGAKPIFVDIRRDTFNIDCNKIANAISDKTKAIIPVHIAGHPCEMEKLIHVAQENKIPIIEDAAHALGAEINNLKIGNIGDITSFSFYATKNLTTGEGGMVTTNNDEFAEKIRLLCLHGMSRDAWKRYSSEGSWYYEILYPGYKYNMSDIQAALGLNQLKNFDHYQRIREEYVQLYNNSFKDIAEIEIPLTKLNIKHAWHLYIIKLNLDLLTINRNEFIQKLFDHNIGTSVHFIPLHYQPYYQKKYGYKNNDFPNAEYVYERVISLPLYPKMTKDDVFRVIDTVISIIKKHRI